MPDPNPDEAFGSRKVITEITDVIGIDSKGAEVLKDGRSALESVAKLGRELPWFMKLGLAKGTRRCLPQIKAIGVTGSCGKTTTVRLIGGILDQEFRGRWSAGDMTSHMGPTVSEILRLRPWHSFYVQELSGHVPVAMARGIRYVRPTIGVVTVVGSDHYKVYRGPDGVAESKGQLIAALPATGTAVLNADDVRVAAMAERTDASIMTFGLAETADVRGTDVKSNWPERLSLTITHRGESRRLQTRLVGTHWTTSILAATAAALAAGATLDACMAGLARTEPTVGRMCPVTLPNGAVVIDDSVKSAYWTMATAIEVMATAQASRKVLVFGTISDYPGAGSPKYRALARDALAVADEVVFVGRNSNNVRKLVEGEGKGRLFMLGSTSDLDRHLRERVRVGDLILMKATLTDHLERAMLSHTMDIACWREGCDRWIRCEECDLRLVPESNDKAAAA